MEKSRPGEENYLLVILLSFSKVEGGVCVGVCCGGGQQGETATLRGKQEIIIKMVYALYLPVAV